MFNISYDFITGEGILSHKVTDVIYVNNNLGKFLNPCQITGKTYIVIFVFYCSCLHVLLTDRQIQLFLFILEVNCQNGF